MSDSESRITRVAQSFRAVTSQIFRCHGLQNVRSDADSFGTQDLVWWLVFLCALGGWFALLYAPQRERLTMLQDRELVLTSHLKEEKKELLRLQRGVAALSKGDPTAWERAARGRLGWLEPGESLDMKAWNQQVRLTAQQNTQRTIPAPIPNPTKTAHILLQPHIPRLPVPPESIGPPRYVIAQDTFDVLGPSLGTPPLAPADPTRTPTRPAPQHTRIATADIRSRNASARR